MFINKFYSWVCKRTPLITFDTRLELYDSLPHPVVAHKAIPEWFKKIKPTVEKQELIEAGTVKRCIPVLDAVTQGFIIPLWADLQVKVYKAYDFKNAKGQIVYTTGSLHPEDLLGTKPKDVDHTLVSYKEKKDLGICFTMSEFDLNGDEGILMDGHAWNQVGDLCDLKKFKFGQVLQKLINPWIIKTSKGYSIQIKNPSNNWSNEITLIEAVVDSDTYYNNINFPFVWTGKEIGEFVIPRGTPIVHIIPFKRKKYKMKVQLQNHNQLIKTNNMLKTKFYDSYKSLFWHKRNQLKD